MVTDDLDRIQSRLHDAGAIWPREELLRTYNDGYRELLALSHAVRRWRLLDLPGRHTYTIAHEWEDRHVTGTLRKPSRTMQSAWSQGSMLWEAEHLAGVTPAAALAGFMQDWERVFTGDSDRHYRFSLPRNHERIGRVTWNERALAAVSVRELDETDDAWEKRVGEPHWWTTGTGRVQSIEVYEIRTDYQQQYALVEYEHGTPRQPTGARTWGVAAGTVGNGWAYTTPADSATLTAASFLFLPFSGVTYAWELAETVVPAYVFTIALPGLTPVVHPWELELVSSHSLASDAASPGQRGIFPWERLSAGYESLTATANVTPVLPGAGLRITTPATDGNYGTQVWEVEFLDGATTFTTGVAQGSYAWEAPYGAALLPLALGEIRGVLSPSRQYLGVASDPANGLMFGTLRDWRSSTDSLGVLEIVLPEAPLGESAVPALIAPPLAKYLRYYVLARCFGRAGEGHNTILADHYQRRFLRGVAFLTRLADVTHRDKVYQRAEVTPTQRRIPRVSLPSEFPAAW